MKVMHFKVSGVIPSPRYPMLRVCWQPDTTSGDVWKSNGFAKCIQSYLYSRTTSRQELYTSALTRLLHLLLYNKGSLKVIEIRNSEDEPNYSILERLDATARSWISFTVRSIAQQTRDVSETNSVTYDINQSEKWSNSDTNTQKQDIFDVIICSRSTQLANVSSYLESIITTSLHNRGILLVPGKLKKSDNVNISLEANEYQLSASASLTIATCKHSNIHIDNGSPHLMRNQKILLVVNNMDHPLNAFLSRQLQQNGQEVTAIKLGYDDLLLLHPDALVIVTAELEVAFLTKATQRELRNVQSLTRKFRKLLWITSGNLTAPSHPESSAAVALSRHLMAHDALIKFVVLDLDCIEEDLTTTIKNIESMIDNWDTCEREYFQKDNVLHISRILPDSTANLVFRQKKEAEPEMTPLSRAGTFELLIKDAGQFDTLYFAQTAVRQNTDIPADHVEVFVKAAGLNAKVSSSLSDFINANWL